MSHMEPRTRMETTYVFKEDLENTTSLFIDQTRNTLHTTATCKKTNSRLCNTCIHSQRMSGYQSRVKFTLDVVAQDLAMTLSTSLSESLFTSLAHINPVQITLDHTFPPFPRPDILI